MMDDILKQIKAGEVSGVQFKESILDKYDIACELVAFSNSDNKYQGTFDGNGKTISNLYINATSVNTGFFGYTTDGSIKNHSSFCFKIS